MADLVGRFLDEVDHRLVYPFVPDLLAWLVGEDIEPIVVTGAPTELVVRYVAPVGGRVVGLTLAESGGRYTGAIVRNPGTGDEKARAVAEGSRRGESGARGGRLRVRPPPAAGRPSPAGRGEPGPGRRFPGTSLLMEPRTTTGDDLGRRLERLFDGELAGGGWGGGRSGGERAGSPVGPGPGRPRLGAPGPDDHVGQAEGVEVVTHVPAHLGPHREEDALALMVTGAVLVGFAEVAGHDGSVDRAHDLAQGDLRRVAGQYVAAAHAPLRPHQTCSLEGEEDLLEVGLGKAGALGDIADRRRPAPSAWRARESNARLA